MAPVDPVSRALTAEKRRGAKRPVLDSHPSIGTYVRDGATQSNFSAVRRDHPEGISKAVSNSAKIQGAARGLVPNFYKVKDYSSQENREAGLGHLDQSSDTNDPKFAK